MTKQRLQIRFSCFIKHHCSYALGPAVVNCLFARGCVRNVFCRRVEPVITKRDCVLYFFKYCGFKILRYDNRLSQKQEKQFPSLFYLCSCNCIVSFVTWCTKNAQFVLKRELTWVPKNNKFQFRRFSARFIIWWGIPSLFILTVWWKTSSLLLISTYALKCDRSLCEKELKREHRRQMLSIWPRETSALRTSGLIACSYTRCRSLIFAAWLVQSVGTFPSLAVRDSH